MLARCIENLEPGKQVAGEEEYEIIVTDDSDDDLSKTMILDRYNFVQWVKGPKRGPAANRNNGAKYAKGSWLVFIDDDCVPGNNLVQSYFKAISNNPVALAFEGSIYPDDWALLKKDMAECPVNTDGGCFWSANICVQKKLFDEIGGFNEQFLIAAQEDQELKIRIESTTKQKIVFVKDAKVTHPVRFSSLRKKVLQIPVASKNFCIYAYNNKRILGYSSLLKFFNSQLTLHFRNVLSQVKKGHLKMTLLSISWLCYGVPLNAFHFSRMGKN